MDDSLSAFILAHPVSRSSPKRSAESILILIQSCSRLARHQILKLPIQTQNKGQNNELRNPNSNGSLPPSTSNPTQISRRISQLHLFHLHGPHSPHRLLCGGMLRGLIERSYSLLVGWDSSSPFVEEGIDISLDTLAFRRCHELLCRGGAGG